MYFQGTCGGLFTFPSVIVIPLNIANAVNGLEIVWGCTTTFIKLQKRRDIERKHCKTRHECIG